MGDAPAASIRMTPEERRAERTAWTAVGVLLLLATLAFLDRQIVSLMVTPIKKDLGVSDLQVSLLQGFSFALLYAVCGVPCGMAVDRFSRRWIIFFGVTIWALATAACGLAHNFNQLLAARFLVGMGEAALLPAALSIIADFFKPQRLTFAISLYSAGALAGLALSLFVGSLIIHWAAAGMDVPVLGHLVTWQVAFLAVGLPGLLMAPLIFIIPEPPRGGQTGGQIGIKHASWGDVFTFVGQRWRFFVTHALGFTSVYSLSIAGMAWVPTFLSRTYGLPIQRVGVLLAIFYLCVGFVNSVISGRIIDALVRRGYRDAHFRFYICVTVVLGICGSLAFQVRWLPLFFAMLALAQLATNMQAPAYSALQIVTPAHMRGRVSSLFLTFSSLAAFTIGPSLVAFFTDKVYHDEQKLFMSMTSTYAIIAPIALVFFFVGLKPMRRAVELAGNVPGRPVAGKTSPPLAETPIVDGASR